MALGLTCGETSILEKWIQGEDEQNQNAPMTRVATKAESHAVYAELVDKIAKRFAKDYPNKSFPSNRTLPELPDCRATLAKEERPLIAERHFFFGSLLLGSSPGRSALQSAE